MACSIGTSTPRSPVEGLIVPMNATSSDEDDCSTLGNASPVSAISAAPASSSVRRSWRGAIAPIASVSSAVPSSEAVSDEPDLAGP